MISTLYFVLFLWTTGNLIYLTQKNYKNTDHYLWTLCVIIPAVIFGYWIKSTVHTPEAAIISLYFIYMFSTVTQVICLFTILNEVGIKVSRSVKTGVYGIAFAHLLSIWLSKDSKLYYTSMEIRESLLGSATIAASGPLKFTHYIFLGGIILAMIIAIIYCILKKDDYSRKTLRIYTIFLVSGIFIYALEMLTNMDFSMLPVIYTLASFVITFNYDHYQSHDLMRLIGERHSKMSNHGFAAFDEERCLLQYNKKFLDILPEIKRVGIDEKITFENNSLIDELYPAIELFEKEDIEVHKLVSDNKIYKLTISTFSLNGNHKTNGYLLDIYDITEETRRREIIEKYNEVLGKEIKEKTEHIAEIQNSIVLGLANMIENRDDNTGGHVKRTSDIIKILVEEVIRRKIYEINQEQAADIIRAAPMHDLGKISIDNSILCKPGKLTDEEFDVMRTHAAKSGEIVKIILDGVEEQHFVDIAYNIARHHHERWDGRGYPDKLIGEKIPVESRIMAVADVYDALVSKRCYKKPMSFEKAYDIISECMGSQFDPAMWPVFIACRPELEAYYKKINQ